MRPSLIWHAQTDSDNEAHIKGCSGKIKSNMLKHCGDHTTLVCYTEGGHLPQRPGRRRDAPAGAPGSQHRSRQPTCCRRRACRAKCGSRNPPCAASGGPRCARDSASWAAPPGASPGRRKLAHNCDAITAGEGQGILLKWTLQVSRSTFPGLHVLQSMLACCWGCELKSTSWAVLHAGCFSGGFNDISGAYLVCGIRLWL